MDTFQQMRRIKHAEYRMNFPLAKREGRKEDFPAGSTALAINGMPRLEKMYGLFVLLQCHLLSEHKNTPTNA
jgi:hypothetical protein